MQITTFDKKTDQSINLTKIKNFTAKIVVPTIKLIDQNLIKLTLQCIHYSKNIAPALLLESVGYLRTELTGEIMARKY